MQAITDWIWLGGTLLLALLILRGAMTGLFRRFPFFFGYLCVVLANTATAAALLGHPVAYGRFYWIWSQPVSLIAFTLVLGEIQELLQLQAPGFRKFPALGDAFGFGLLALSLISAIWSGSFRPVRRRDGHDRTRDSRAAGGIPCRAGWLRFVLSNPASPRRPGHFVGLFVDHVGRHPESC